MSSKTKPTATKEEATPSLVPKLRFPEFRDAEAWQSGQLEGALSSISNGLVLEQGGDTSGYKVTRIETISAGTIDLDKVGLVKTSQDISAYKLRVGDILLSNINSVAHIGKSVFVDRDYDLYHGMNLLRLGVNRTKHDPQFIYYLINTDGIRASLRERANKAVNQASINQTELGKTAVALPLKPEQQKIAECLSSVDELIAAQARKLDALKTHKKGLMQQLFPREGETQPRLRFPEFQNAGEWEEKRLDELVDIQSGATPSKANPAFWNGSVPWVSAKDMKRLFLEDAEDHISAAAVDDGARLVPPGTLLVLTRGMTLLKDVPICVLCREMSFNQDVKGLRPKDGADGLFLAWMLTGNKQRLLAMVDIAGHGTGKLDTDELKALQLMVPPPAEQERIATCLSSLDALITAENQKHEALKTHKKGLMQQLFPSPEATADL
jgi:type I restriction enzyme S subunit